MNSLLQDVRYALRTFAASRGLTATAILSLALAIGANTAIFSVASALLLRPLPYQDPEQLAILWNRSPGLGIDEDWFSTAQYFDIRNSASSFEQIAIAIGANLNLTGDGEPERIGTVRVSPNLLPMLGAHPAIGRTFTAEDGCGRRRRHGDPSSRHVDAPLRWRPWRVGKTLVLNGAAIPDHRRHAETIHAAT